MKEKINQSIYYIIIGCVSLIAIIVFPLLSSEVGLDIQLPNTIMGWVVYVGSALATAIVNMMIFYSFMNQAKINIKDNPRYIEANEIMLRLSINHPDKIKLPRSPKKWTRQQYSGKGITLFIGSCLSCFVFTNAILTYNLITLLTYTFTVLFAIFFGIFQMKKAESYWTDEYYRYAKYQEEIQEVHENDNNQQQGV